MNKYNLITRGIHYRILKVNKNEPGDTVCNMQYVVSDTFRCSLNSSSIRSPKEKKIKQNEISIPIKVMVFRAW